METKTTLLSLLTDYLAGETKAEYPELEVSLVQLDPLRVSDDGKHYMELSNILGDVEAKVTGDPLNYRLVLVHWQFDFKRVPNSQDRYVDLSCRDFRLLKTSKKAKIGTLKPITENKGVAKLLAAKKQIKTQKGRQESQSTSRKSFSPMKQEKVEARKSPSSREDREANTELPRALKRVYKNSNGPIDVIFAPMSYTDLLDLDFGRVSAWQRKRAQQMAICKSPKARSRAESRAEKKEKDGRGVGYARETSESETSPMKGDPKMARKSVGPRI